MSNGTDSYTKNTSFNFSNFKPGFIEISFDILMFCDGDLFECFSGDDYFSLSGFIQDSSRKTSSSFRLEYKFGQIQNSIFWNKKKESIYLQDSGDLKVFFFELF